MKKFVKAVALIACAALLCVSLCSCELLDEAKRTTAYFTDETEERLTFDDSVYIRINTPAHVSFLMNDAVSGFHACTPDIPVLLAEGWGRVMLFQKSDAEHPRVVSVFHTTYEYFTSYSTSYADAREDSNWDKMAYYIREDAYDAVMKLIEEKDCSSYCTFIYKYDYSIADAPEGNTLLEDDTTAAVKKALKSDEKVKWSELGTGKDWYAFDLVCCDKNMLITDNRSVCIVTDGKEFYAYDDTYNDPRTPLYRVADEDYKAMMKLYNMAQYCMEIEDVESRIATEEFDASR